MPREFRLPSFGSGLKEAQLLAWKVKVGDRVSAGQTICDVETEKSVIELPSPYGGIVEQLGVEAGGRLNVGEVVLRVRLDGEQAGTPAPVAPHPKSDTAEIQPLSRATVASVSTGEDRQTPLSMARRTIAAHLARSWQEIPHVFTRMDVDASALLAARSGLSQRIGGKFPLEALLIHAVLPLLQRYPEFNSSFTEDALVYRSGYHIGVAVDLPSGLTVPVVRDAQKRSLIELGAAVRELLDKAAARTLRPEEQSGATFTVNNVGALGPLSGTSVIPYGTAAILSMARATQRAIVLEGQVAIAAMAELSLSFDHRIIDGGLAQRFMGDLQRSVGETLSAV